MSQGFVALSRSKHAKYWSSNNELPEIVRMLSNSCRYEATDMNAFGDTAHKLQPDHGECCQCRVSAFREEGWELPYSNSKYLNEQLLKGWPSTKEHSLHVVLKESSLCKLGACWIH